MSLLSQPFQTKCCTINHSLGKEVCLVRNMSAWLLLCKCTIRVSQFRKRYVNIHGLCVFDKYPNLTYVVTTDTQSVEFLTVHIHAHTMTHTHMFTHTHTHTHIWCTRRGGGGGGWGLQTKLIFHSGHIRIHKTL